MRALKQDKIISYLVVLLLLLGIGYAYLTTNLSIDGTSDIKGASWNIHFENVDVTAGSVTATNEATINASGNTVSYTITLNEPGDYYEFTVDVKNDGTLDGMISSVTSKLDGNDISTLPSYLEYYVTYEDQTEININQLLAAGDKDTYKVRIGYKNDIDASDLPNTDKSLNLSFNVTYIQANDSANPRSSNFMYLLTDSQYSIGDTVENIENSRVTSPDILFENFCHPFFTRETIINNIITERYLGFLLNGNYYYLKGSRCEYNSAVPDNIIYYETSPYYLNNKKILQRAFGSSNCSDNSGYDSVYGGPYVSYECSAYNLDAIAYSYGFVEISDGEWYSRINNNSFIDFGHYIGHGYNCYPGMSKGT